MAMSSYQIVSECQCPTVTIRDPKDCYETLSPYKDSERECFLLLTLSPTHEIIRIHLISIGTLTRTIVHPRDVFRRAILDNSAAIIVAHNHPSNDPKPSEGDIETTNRLVDASDIIGIPLLDHLIISKDGYYSMAKNGLLKQSCE
jgi:DNA repair protein RadC